MSIFRPITGYLAAFVLFILIAFVPLCVLSLKALPGGGTSGVALLSPRQGVLLAKTALIALSVSTGALLLGIPCAAALRCMPRKARGFLFCLLLVPLFIPPYVMGIAWPYLGSGWGLKVSGQGWTCLLLAICYFPLITLFALAGLSAVSRPVLDAARLRWGWPGIACRVILPLVGKNIAIGFILVTVLALGEYGLAALLQVQTYPVEIMTEFSAFYDAGAALRLCIPFAMVAVIAFAVLSVLINHQYRIVPRRSESHEGPAGRFWVVISLLVLSAVFVVSVVIPLYSLMSGLKGWPSLVKAWKTAHVNLMWSLLISSMTAGLALLIGWPLALLQLNARKWGGYFIDLMTLLPLVVPGSVVGIAYIVMWNRPCMKWFYGSWLILPVVMLACFLPVAQKALVAGCGMVHSSIRDATRMAPRGFLFKLCHIEIPLAKRSLLLGWLAVFVLSFRELGATVLVSPPACETLALRTYTLSHYGANDVVMALCLMSIVIGLCGYGLVIGLTGRTRRV